MIPISLYIHLPWCLKKCPYCDFNAHPIKEETDFNAYVSRLIEDLSQYTEILEKRKLCSIFIGGGTPSLFSGKELAPLFKTLSQYQVLDMEITIEANPGTQDYAHYQEYRDLGINRISIGGQSFNPEMLQHLGRFHSSDQTHQAILKAQSSGFERINLDIMHGLPHQTTQQALEDLQSFLEHKIEHLSWYQLNIEKNTLFYVKKPLLPSEETLEEIDRYGSALLKEHGYRQYETSAWTSNLGSRHNLNYWHFGDYIGIGAGAHSKITLEPFAIQRTIKHKHPKAYMQNLIQSQTIVPSEEIILEYIIGQFRTKDPLFYSEFEKRTQLPKTRLQEALSKAEKLGLLSLNTDNVILSDKGFNHHNDICLSLLG